MPGEFGRGSSISRDIGGCEPIIGSTVCLDSLLKKYLVCLKHFGGLPVCHEIKRLKVTDLELLVCFHFPSGLEPVVYKFRHNEKPN